VLSCDYNGWNDAPEEEREWFDQHPEIWDGPAQEAVIGPARVAPRRRSRGCRRGNPAMWVGCRTTTFAKWFVPHSTQVEKTSRLRPVPSTCRTARRARPDRGTSSRAKPLASRANRVPRMRVTSLV
jgi:hypothetical protein